jgi:murein DD-endopeptidase MepM/ murein hydrolase activator NlpD
MITVEFPLCGEWFVGADGSEPGHELAFDFMRLDTGLKATPRAAWQELLRAVPLEEHYGWGQPIVSPFEGKVITAVDGAPEPCRSYLAALGQSLATALSPRAEAAMARLQAGGEGIDLRPYAGNHLVIESLAQPGVFAFLAHARQGSILVRAGDTVAAKQAVAQVGHSGESMVPHLHFHLMSGPHPLHASPLPLCFARYELWQQGVWAEQKNALPKRKQRVRSIPN